MRSYRHSYTGSAYSYDQKWWDRCIRPLMEPPRRHYGTRYVPGSTKLPKPAPVPCGEYPSIGAWLDSLNDAPWNERRTQEERDT